MEYDEIVNNLMYHIGSEMDIEKYLVDISDSILLSSVADTEYKKFTAFSSIYAKICEQLEIYPHGHTIIYKGNKYEGKQVYGNLKGAKQIISNYLLNFIQQRSEELKDQ